MKNSGDGDGRHLRAEICFSLCGNLLPFFSRPVGTWIRVEQDGFRQTVQIISTKS